MTATLADVAQRRRRLPDRDSALIEEDLGEALVRTISPAGSSDVSIRCTA
jgi:hypothetical protein